MKRLLIPLLSIALCAPARVLGFIPPVPAIVKEIFEPRKPKKAIEVHFRHHVTLRPGEVVDVEERILHDRGRPQFLWRVGGVSFGGSFDRRTYVIEGGQKQVPSSTGAFLKYFLATNPDEFLNVLIAEQYVRRDQLMQFKPGWNPEGDPNLWDVKGNYLAHPDVFFQRLAHGTGIAVLGSEGRAVYFDNALKGVRRIESRDDKGTRAWEFDLFTNIQHEGVYPKFLYHELNGEERIRSELVTVRTLTDRQVAELSNQIRHPARGVSGAAEAALTLLLGYR